MLFHALPTLTLNGKECIKFDLKRARNNSIIKSISLAVDPKNCSKFSGLTPRTSPPHSVNVKVLHLSTSLNLYQPVIQTSNET